MKTDNIKKHLKNKHAEFVNGLYHKETKELIKKKSYFAGGCVRDLQKDENPKDYDLFFIDDESVKEFKNLVGKEFGLKKTKIGNFNCQRTSVQVITLTSGSPSDLIETFDFTINCGYYIPQMDVLLKAPRSNYLEVCPYVLSPLQALMRVEKFRKKGYDVPSKVLVDLGVAISKMKPLDTEDKVRDALKGMSFSEILEGAPQLSIFKDNVITEKDYSDVWLADDIPF